MDGDALAIVGDRGFRHIPEDRPSAELSAGFGSGDKGVGLDLTGPKALQVVLDVRLEVIRMLRIGEVLPAAGFEVINPTQPVGLDEFVVETEAIDDQVVG